MRRKREIPPKKNANQLSNDTQAAVVIQGPIPKHYINIVLHLCSDKGPQTMMCYPESRKSRIVKRSSQDQDTAEECAQCMAGLSNAVKLLNWVKATWSFGSNTQAGLTGLAQHCTREGLSLDITLHNAEQNIPQSGPLRRLPSTLGTLATSWNVSVSDFAVQNLHIKNEYSLNNKQKLSKISVGPKGIPVFVAMQLACSSLVL